MTLSAHLTVSSWNVLLRETSIGRGIDMKLRTLLLSPKGRIGRVPFLLVNIGLAVVYLAVGALAASWQDWAMAHLPRQAALSQGLVIYLGLTLALSYPSICSVTKRLHDHGRSGWWQLAPMPVFAAAGVFGDWSDLPDASNAIAIASLIFGFAALATALGCVLYLGFARGQADANRFGPPVETELAAV